MFLITRSTIAACLFVLSMRGEDSEWASLCTVLTHLGNFAGKRVTIQGEIVTGREAFYLRDSNCEKGPKTGDYVWPPELWLTPPNESAPLPKGRRYDRASFERLHADVARKAQQGRVRIMASVTGTIRTRENLGAVRASDGRWLTNGLGHLNVFPAEMILESVANWVITAVKPNELGKQ